MTDEDALESFRGEACETVDDFGIVFGMG